MHGLTQSSIYARWRQARTLLRSLKHYLDSILRERIHRLETSMSPGQAISAFFGEIVERSLADPQHRGCMLVNTALEATSDDPDLQRFVADETS
jgi:TetR/AcrR family transcriptional repressor of nem operon